MVVRGRGYRGGLDSKARARDAGADAGWLDIGSCLEVALLLELG